MGKRQIKAGDAVVYRKLKRTTHPGPRAQGIRAEPKGDYYTYFVDKFWVVREVLAGGKLLVETRRGKRHVIDPGDPNLRRPSILQKLLFSERFPQFH